MHMKAGVPNNNFRNLIAPAWKPKTPVAVDVYQGEYPVDLAGLNPDLCIIRASAQSSRHVRYKDVHTLNYVNECKQLGIKYGLYHYLKPHGIAEQATIFLQQWEAAGGADLRPVVDVEVDPRDSDCGYSTWALQIKTWMDTVANETGYDPIVYTSMYKWQFTGHPAWAADYDLWAAWYPFKPDDFATLPDSRTPPGFKRLGLWQYAEDGRSQGYKANDYNWMAQWLQDELGAVTPPTPDPDPDPDPGTGDMPPYIDVRYKVGDVVKEGRYDLDPNSVP